MRLSSRSDEATTVAVAVLPVESKFAFVVEWNSLTEEEELKDDPAGMAAVDGS